MEYQDLENETSINYATVAERCLELLCIYKATVIFIDSRSKTTANIVYLRKMSIIFWSIFSSKR